jgi:hypothetical protein
VKIAEHRVFPAQVGKIMAKTIIVVLCFLLGIFSSPSRAQDIGPWIGTIRDDGSYQLRFDFGIEQWEEGKLTTHRKQQWVLRCSYPDPFENLSSTTCSLDRVIIDKGWRPSDGDMIGKHSHNSSDGTLKFVSVNWPRGVLDFTVVHTDRSTIEVLMRFKAKGTILYLDSFKATGIARGVLSDSMSTIEYRIPKYSYVLSVPVDMRGLRSATDKEWDELLSTISKEDQKIWHALFANPPKDCWPSSSLSEETNESLRDAQLIKFVNASTDGWAKCLAKSKISVSSQKKIVGLLRRQLTLSVAK